MIIAAITPLLCFLKNTSINTKSTSKTTKKILARFIHSPLHSNYRSVLLIFLLSKTIRTTTTNINPQYRNCPQRMQKLRTYITLLEKQIHLFFHMSPPIIEIPISNSTVLMFFYKISYCSCTAQMIPAVHLLVLTCTFPQY